MSVNTENNIRIHPQTVSLKERVQANLQDRKVQSLGVATGAERGAAISRKPFATITALATTAFNSIGLCSKALFSNLTNKIAVTPTKANSVQKDTNNQSFAQRTKNFIYSAVNYAKGNPIQIALGGSAILLGYGAYAYATSGVAVLPETLDLNTPKSDPGVSSEPFIASNEAIRKAGIVDQTVVENQDQTTTTFGPTFVASQDRTGIVDQIFAESQDQTTTTFGPALVASQNGIVIVNQMLIESRNKTTATFDPFAVVRQNGVVIVNQSAVERQNQTTTIFDPFVLTRQNDSTNKLESSLDFFEIADSEGKEIGHWIAESGVYKIYTIPNNFLRLSVSFVNNNVINPTHKHIYHESWVQKNVASPIIEHVLVPVSEWPVISPAWDTTKKIAEFCKEHPLTALLVVAGVFIAYKTITAQEAELPRQELGSQNEMIQEVELLRQELKSQDEMIEQFLGSLFVDLPAPTDIHGNPVLTTDSVIDRVKKISERRKVAIDY